MNNINTVTVVGRLTRDAELKYTSGGMAVCKLSLANNYSRKSGDEWKEEVSYFDISMFGKRAESVSKYLTKGKPVAISGTLRQERWESNGEKRSKVVIIANDVEMFGGKTGSGPVDAEDVDRVFHDEIPW